MRPRLTPRELDVLACLARGLSVAETAAELWLSRDTIKTYRKRVYAELGVNSAAGAVEAARERGLLESAR